MKNVIKGTVTHLQSEDIFWGIAGTFMILQVFPHSTVEQSLNVPKLLVTVFTFANLCPSDQTLVFQHAHSTEAGHLTGFCQTGWCAHEPNVRQFLLNRLIFGPCVPGWPSRSLYRRLKEAIIKTNLCNYTIFILKIHFFHIIQ